MAHLDIFGKPIPEKPPGRYEVKASGPEWETLEDLALWPVLVECESEVSYRMTCRWLCSAFGREPRCPDDRLLKESVALIEMRTVTRHMEGVPVTLSRAAERLLNGHRSGKVLSWAEKHKFLKQYHNKLANKRPRIRIDELLPLMGRNEKDTYQVMGYLAGIDYSSVDKEEDVLYKDPIRDHSLTRRLLARCVTTASPALWKGFCDHLQGKPC